MTPECSLSLPMWRPCIGVEERVGVWGREDWLAKGREGGGSVRRLPLFPATLWSSEQD